MIVFFNILTVLGGLVASILAWMSAKNSLDFSAVAFVILYLFGQINRD